MNDKNLNEGDTGPDRWAMIASFRRRSEESANFLRTLLFALAGGALGFVANKSYPNTTLVDLLAIASFAISIGLNFWSWDLQKSKTFDRIDALRRGGHEEFMRLEAGIATSPFRKNILVDRWSFGFIVVGFLIAFLSRLSLVCS